MAKVLLVEDDNNLREIYEARLQAEGYEIVSANDGEQALVVAKNEKPDLVISDVMMPKISGFEMLDILRNTDGLKDVKVIMLTALGQAEDKTRADQLGANRYLVKSQVTLEDIVKTAHQLLDDEPAEAAAAPAGVPATPAQVTASAVPVSTPPDQTAVTNVPVATAPEPATAAETTAEEEADMAAQINSFEQQPAAVASPAPAATTAAAADPITPAAAPEPVPMPEQPATVPPASDQIAAPAPAASPAAASDEPPADDDPAATAANDKTMSDAVASLTPDEPKPSDVSAVEVAPEADADSTAPASAAPAHTPAKAADQGDDGVTIAHKKVIQPINDLSNGGKPNINDLVAAEAAKSAAADAEAEAAAILAASPPQAAPEPVPAPTEPVARAEPAPLTPEPAAPPASPAAPQPPAPAAPAADGLDPNSIAL